MLDKLQGTWYIATLEMNGAEAPPSGSIEIKGSGFKSEGVGAIYEGTIKVDAKKKPHAIDLVFTKGPEKGNVNAGIFELTRGGWRLCLNTRGTERPRKFSSTDGEGFAVETLTRKKPAAKPAAAPSAAGADSEWQMVSYINNGAPLEAQWLQYGRRLVKGDAVTVTMGGQVQLQAKFTVNRDSQPNQMDYELKNGKIQLGIFKLEGNELTVCTAAQGKPRPTEFASKKGDGRQLTVWRLLPAK